MLIWMLNKLFPETIAQIRNKAYEVGKRDTMDVYKAVIKHIPKNCRVCSEPIIKEVKL